MTLARVLLIALPFVLAAVALAAGVVTAFLFGVPADRFADPVVIGILALVVLILAWTALVAWGGSLLDDPDAREANRVDRLSDGGAS